MYEISNYINRKGKLSTGIQRVNYPIHKGKPNPVHGKYYLVGSIPMGCYDTENRRSLYYDTEEEAISAAIASGAEKVQNTKCEKVFGW